MTAIIDYDAGNVKSVEKALQSLGEEVVVTRDKEMIRHAERVILPGVGAFGDAMEKLHHFELTDVIRETIGQGTPFLGICLGLQLLFDESEESPGVTGLGILQGKIVRIPDGGGLKVPHIGWNSLTYPHPGRLYDGIPENAYVYFVHSYYLQARDQGIVSAETDYGVRIQASVERGNLFACQFHPEKSSSVGLAILKNFLKAGRG
ncbi:MAG: imidazole glycerol phosphate synthase subunit HisH [Lachnospiraceae bacterium]|nr:imidazole glycerol phosphate synthase subunit HisH [Lachnospiraceae bacterium]